MDFSDENLFNSFAKGISPVSYYSIASVMIRVCWRNSTSLCVYAAPIYTKTKLIKIDVAPQKY